MAIIPLASENAMRFFGGILGIRQSIFGYVKLQAYFVRGEQWNAFLFQQGLDLGDFTFVIGGN